MKFSKRETLVLIAAALLLLASLTLKLPQAGEILYLLFIVAPLGYLLATDPAYKK